MAFVNIDASGFSPLLFTSIFLAGALDKADEVLGDGFSFFSLGAKIGATLDDVFATFRGGSVSDDTKQISEAYICYL